MNNLISAATCFGHPARRTNGFSRRDAGSTLIRGAKLTSRRDVRQSAVRRAFIPLCLLLAALAALALTLSAQTPEPPPAPDPEPELNFTLRVPDNFAVPSCDGAAVVVEYPAPVALSRCTNVTAVFANPPSGSLFPLGQTVITCWATNNCGDVATNTFSITVTRDLSPPILTCPDPVITYATTPEGIEVFYELPAVTDDADPSPTLVCTPPPGSVFPPGTNVVNCVVTDACGRSNTCSFTIEVRGAQMRIATVPNPVGGGRLVSVTAEGFTGMDVTGDLNGEWTPLGDVVLAESPQSGTNKFFGPPGMDGVLRAPDWEIAYVAVGPNHAWSHPYPPHRKPDHFLSDESPATNGLKVLSGDTGGTENIWSDPLTLPFNFYFFGRQYKQFRVSKNGLLTFSTNLASNTQGLGYFNFPQFNTTNVMVNPLPTWTNGFRVDNTIFALAGRYVTQSSSDGVYAHVRGGAPNRQVWIVFDHPKDLYGRTLTAIVLHEGVNWIHIVDMFTATNTVPAPNRNSRLMCGLQGTVDSWREVRQIPASPFMMLVSTNGTNALDNAAYLFRPYVLGYQTSGQAAPQLMAATNLDLFITEQMRQLGIPGMTVAISRNGRLIFNKAYGYRNVEFGMLMQPHHRACIGSVSKVLAAFGLTAMIEDGIVTNLQERVYSPNRLGQAWFWNEVNLGIANNVHTNFFANTNQYLTVISNINLRHLLTHTAGFNNLNNDFQVANTYTSGNYLQVTPRHHVQWHIRTQPLVTNNVALMVRYSNPGFKHLGVFMEEALGQNFEAWMRNRLFTPAGVHHARLMTIYEWDQTSRDARRYRAYVPDTVTNPGVPTTDVPWFLSRISGAFGPLEYGDAAYGNAADGAAGSWTATAEDLVRFMAAVDGLPNRPDVIPEARWLQLEQTAFGTPSGQGVGWDSVNATRVWKNGGINYGAAHLVRSRAPDRLTVAVVANTGLSVTPLGNAIWDAVNPLPPINPLYDLFGLQLQSP